MRMLIYTIGRFIVFIFGGHLYTHDLARGWLEKQSNTRCFYVDARDDEVEMMPGECATLLDGDEPWIPVFECNQNGCAEPEVEFKW